MRRMRLSLSAVLLVGLIVLVGCGGKKPVTVQGKVILPQGMTLQKDDSVEIRFAPSDVKEKGASTTLQVSDLSFTTKDVVPGTYKITVSVTPYAGQPGSDKRIQQLEPFNTAYNMTNSKLNVEVTADPTQNITVDLAKGNVSKN